MSLFTNLNHIFLISCSEFIFSRYPSYEAMLLLLFVISFDISSSLSSSLKSILSSSSYILSCSSVLILYLLCSWIFVNIFLSFLTGSISFIILFPFSSTAPVLDLPRPTLISELYPILSTTSSTSFTKYKLIGFSFLSRCC